MENEIPIPLNRHSKVALTLVELAIRYSLAALTFASSFWVKLDT